MIMSGRNNRQVKTHAVELGEIKREEIDPSAWRRAMGAMIEKLGSGRAEDRIQSMKTAQHLFTTVFVGDELDEYMNDIIVDLVNRFRDQCEREEHQNMCELVSVLGLNMGHAFEPYAETLFADIIPSLQRLEDGETDRLSMIACVTSFCIKTMVGRRVIVKALTDFLSCKGKGKDSERSTELRAAALRALSVVMSGAEDELFGETLPRLHEIIAHRLNSTKFEILAATVELASVVLDYLQDISERDGDDGRPSKEFRNTYFDRISALHRKMVGKKTEMKELQRKTAVLVRQFDGELASEQICLHDQNVEFFGKRMHILLKAVRHVSNRNFEAQMARNPVIHRYFQFRLLEPSYVARLRKKQSATMKRHRDEAAKDREQDISLKRKRKEMREERNDD